MDEEGGKKKSFSFPGDVLVSVTSNPDETFSIPDVQSILHVVFSCMVLLFLLPSDL